MNVRASTSLLPGLMVLCVALQPWVVGASQAESLEDIYVLRSIREQRPPVPGFCSASRTGFEPAAADAERHFSFWSIQIRIADARIEDARREQVADLHACFGTTSEPARQNFYAEIRLGDLRLEGKGECLAVLVDFPEPGLYPVRCQLILGGLPAPFVGGLLTTNTITSGAAFGADTRPSGYIQASIATIRLWRARPKP